jgi:hypothetical protein
MRKYIFARVIIEVNASNISDAVEALVEENPKENIKKLLEEGKILLVNAKTIPRTKQYKVKQGLDFCPKCKRMHKQGSSNWNTCLSPKREGGILNE